MYTDKWRHIFPFRKKIHKKYNKHLWSDINLRTMQTYKKQCVHYTIVEDRCLLLKQQYGKKFSQYTTSLVYLWH